MLRFSRKSALHVEIEVQSVNEVTLPIRPQATIPPENNIDIGGSQFTHARVVLDHMVVTICGRVAGGSVVGNFANTKTLAKINGLNLGDAVLVATEGC